MEGPKTITIYGFGYVGKGIWNFLKDHYSIQIFDPVVRDPLVINDFSKLAKTPYAVICVPTPERKDGSCDTSIVEDLIKKSAHQYYLIKSTVIPGTTASLIKKTGKKIAFSPEYLGEGRYEIPFWKDFPHPTNMKLHQFHIFGGSKVVTKKWVELWQKIGGWSPVYAQTDSTTAELVKYMENSFIGTKKIFCDEFYEIAQVLGVDYNELKELWLLDGRVGRSTTLVFPDKRGLTGKCIPKDVRAIVTHLGKLGHTPKLLKEVLSRSKTFKNKSS